MTLMLTACASTQPGQPQYPMDKVTSAIGSAGNRVWTGTKHLFKLKDRSAAEKPDEFLDEVDLALLEDGEYNEMLAAETVSTAPVLLPSDEFTIVEEAESIDILADLENEPAASEKVIDSDGEDLFHTVGENETLWILAKQLTGDANNWRILASLNDLDENGSVYVGQKIRIPADMKNLPTVNEVELTTVAAASANNPVEAKKEVVSTEKLVAKKPASAEAGSGPSQEFTVEAGETLWHLAKRSTGNANNWKIIANFNAFDEKAASNIRYGQKINVPESLLSTGSEGSEKAAPKLAAAKETVTPTQTPKEAAAEAVARLTIPKSASGTAENQQLAAAGQTDTSAKTETPKLVTVDANFKAEPPTIEVEKAEQALAVDSRKKSQEIMISGTYYPKAIYNDANFSSSLLMRVSPGTKLKVSRAIGPWFEVVTDRGVGFVHSRDTK